MNYAEAIEWLKGNRSTVNMVPQHPIETWQERIANADAGMAKQAYYMAKARTEGLVML